MPWGYGLMAVRCETANVGGGLYGIVLQEPIFVHSGGCCLFRFALVSHAKLRYPLEEPHSLKLWRCNRVLA